MDEKPNYLGDGDSNAFPLQPLPSRSEDATTQKSPLKVRSYSLFTVQNKPLPVQKLTERTASEEFLPSDDKFKTLPGAKISRMDRPSRRSRRLNTLLLEAAKSKGVQEIETLLKAGANPNATCAVDCVSACHVAAMRNDETLYLLLKSGAEKKRFDRFGRTPLHLAAWAGNVGQVAMLLGLPEDLQSRIQINNMDVNTVEEIKSRCESIRDLTNFRCDFNQASMSLPKEWKDSSIDHNCKKFVDSLPFLQPGWSALLAASARARPHCVRLLLAAGTDACARDLVCRTALDVAGSAFYTVKDISAQDFAEVVKLLLDTKCTSNTLRSPKNLDTPLHTAVELGSLDAIKALLAAHAPVNVMNRLGLTPLHLCVKKKSKNLLQVLANNSDTPLAIETKDKDGRTVLHAAVLEQWVPGVCVALESGAKITTKDNDGETSIHLAAAQGNADVLNEVLSATDQITGIDIFNANGETALFKAVINGHVDCAKKILKEGASITITLPKQVNVFHIAAEKGYAKLLKVLLDHDYNITRGMINFLTTDDRQGYGPIHFAVRNNHIDCVKLLLSRNAYVSLRTSYGLHKFATPLHLAALNNNVEIAKIIMKFDKTTVHLVDDIGWSALHTASHHGNRDMIALLLKEGANLSSYTNRSTKCRTTAIDMIMNNLSKPTNFIENIFDSYINTNDLNIQDPNCEVTVDFRIFVPVAEDIEQMKVVEAILSTGDRYGQRQLLIHPLLESFLYLKWKSLLPFFYLMIAFYGWFVLSLTVFIISVFFHIDLQKESPMATATNWAYAVYVTACLVISQELLYANINRKYFLQLEIWVKLGSLILAVILPYSITEMTEKGVNWPRHVATVALLLSWLEMTFLLSRFPNWGYYVLMFGKVSTNVIKILLTFMFLVVGFALSFMVQLHSRSPFENPWAAFVKTMVMMTSEFDYDDLVEKEDSADGSSKNKPMASLLTVRLVFLAFLILAAIVLMNLMVGVAVNDLHNLQVLGNIRRLVKQVEFLSSLEHLFYNRFFKKILPVKLDTNLRNKKKVLREITIKPSVPSSKYYRLLPNHIREAIFEKAQSQKRLIDEELGSKMYKKKLDEIYIATVHQGSRDKLAEKPESTVSTFHQNNKLYEELVIEMKELNSAIHDLRIEMEQRIQDTNSSISRLDKKVDILLKLNQPDK